MTDPEWWEDFKTDFQEKVREARAIIECMQLYGVPANCDQVKMAKDVEAFRGAWERMAETLEAIAASAKQKRKAEWKSIASLARATAFGIAEAV